MATADRPTGTSELLRNAMLSGAISAVINGSIQAYLLRGKGPIPISVDSISAGSETVLSAAVPLAVSLAMILTAVAHWTLKTPKKPFFPTTLWLVIKHGLFAFGAVVAASVMWQRAAGTVEVSVGTAVVLLAVVAGIIAFVVNYMTLTEIQK